MEFKFSIELNESEIKLLENIFSCKDNELNEILSSIGEASLQEYLRMILGQKVFTRGQDIKEYRLFLLIKHYFKHKIPDEQIISTLFQTTSSESKSIMKSVFAKYQYELRNSIDEYIKNVLMSINKKDEEKSISNIPLNIIDELNKVIGTIDGRLQPINKKRNSAQTFEIKDATYLALMKHFKITSDENE